MVAKNAIECINREVQQDVDVYTLSLVAYVNTLYDPANQTTEEIMAMLEEKATVDGTLCLVGVGEEGLGGGGYTF